MSSSRWTRRRSVGWRRSRVNRSSQDERRGQRVGAGIQDSVRKLSARTGQRDNVQHCRLRAALAARSSPQPTAVDQQARHPTPHPGCEPLFKRTSESVKEALKTGVPERLRIGRTPLGGDVAGCRAGIAVEQLGSPGCAPMPITICPRTLARRVRSRTPHPLARRSPVRHRISATPDLQCRRLPHPLARHLNHPRTPHRRRLYFRQTLVGIAIRLTGPEI